MKRIKQKRYLNWLGGLALLGLLTVTCLARCLPAAKGQQIERLGEQLLGKLSDRATVERLGTLDSPLIPESSGLAISGYRDDVLWTVNDSGNTNHLFGLTFTGDLLCRVKLEGTTNRDWESMARWRRDQQHFLIVAEVGDNLARYPVYSLFFLEEPQFEIDPSGALPIELIAHPQRLDFVYEDGARDCEAVAVDPLTGDIWLVEKVASLNPNRQPAGVYHIPFSHGIEPLWKLTTDPLKNKKQDNNQDKKQDNGQKADGRGSSPDQTPVKVERLGDLPYRYVTGMDFSADGNWLVIRTYPQALLYHRGVDESWLEAFQKRTPQTIILPIQRQGETVAFTNDSQAVIITSEKVGQPIWRIDLQKLQTAIKSAAEGPGYPLP